MKRCRLSCDKMSSSPYRRHENDVEAGRRYNGDDEEETEEEGPFNIYRTKSASLHRLKRWRVCYNCSCLCLCHLWRWFCLCLICFECLVLIFRGSACLVLRFSSSESESKSEILGRRLGVPLKWRNSSTISIYLFSSLVILPLWFVNVRFNFLVLLLWFCSSESETEILGMIRAVPWELRCRNSSTMLFIKLSRPLKSE